jgi:hypothetical protein
MFYYQKPLLSRTKEPNAGVNIEVREGWRLHLSGTIATVLDVPVRG